MAFNWVPDPILYVTESATNSIVLLKLRPEGEVFAMESATRLKAAELDVPVDVAPAVPEVGNSVFSSNTTLAGGADLYVVNRGSGTIVRLKQTGEVVALCRVTLPGTGPLGAGRLNGIAVSPDAGRIWVTVSGRIELPAFGAPGSPPRR
jgi:DNA-binding beta-propeller fold protein YncE